MVDKAIITKVIDKNLTKPGNVRKVKPVIVFAKKEKKKYSFNKNTNNYYYNKTINNNNSFVTPEINKEDGFIISLLKLFSSLFSLFLFLIKHFFSSLFNGDWINLSNNNRKIRKKKKHYNKFKEV